MSIFQLYLDTSVISAYFDFYKPARQIITQKWFQHNAHDFTLFASTLVGRGVPKDHHAGR